MIVELLALCICHFFSLFSVFISKKIQEKQEASPEFEVLSSGGVSQRVLRTGSWSLETVPCPPAENQLALQGLKVRFPWR